MKWDHPFFWSYAFHWWDAVFLAWVAGMFLLVMYETWWRK